MRTVQAIVAICSHTVLLVLAIRTKKHIPCQSPAIQLNTITNSPNMYRTLTMHPGPSLFSLATCSNVPPHVQSDPGPNLVLKISMSHIHSYSWMYFGMINFSMRPHTARSPPDLHAAVDPGGVEPFQPGGPLRLIKPALLDKKSHRI